MFTKYINFIHGVSANWYGRLGVILTTSSFVTLVILELARITGAITNAYVGLVTYMLFPSLFVIGLLLIPMGWRRLQKKTGKSTRELLGRKFGPDAVTGSFFGSRIFATIGILTLLNIIFLGGVSVSMLHFMDGAEFCGTACHSVMNPEWTTYQKSPHARVPCVDCHVGEGVGALASSKLNGIWQMVSVTFDLLERPIPTPVHQLRPARETCEKCHWPQKFYGNRLKTITHYQTDSASTPKYNTLALKIDAGTTGNKSGIHWHIGAENQIRYASINDDREEMLWVEVRRTDGSYHRFTNSQDPNHESSSDVVRIMDCVDCHNRATHIYEQPERAVDDRLALRAINRRLPYIKREALGAVLASYVDDEAAREGVSDQLHGFYRRHYPNIERELSPLIDSAADVLGEVYTRNIHQEMNIEWNSYPSHVGHKGGGGCFRCHNPKMIDDNGIRISDDCTLCHSILAYDQTTPYEFLQPADTTDPDYPMHQYLGDEFRESISK